MRGTSSLGGAMDIDASVPAGRSAASGSSFSHGPRGPIALPYQCPSCAAAPHEARQRLTGNHRHAQLDLFGAAPPADPLLGIAVTLPDTCSKCADLVAIIGPGKPPHSASVLCRSCGLHRGWLSRANYTFLNEAINTGGALREPIVLRTPALKPEPNDDGISVVQQAPRFRGAIDMKKG